MICELQGHKGEPREAVGYFQVYDDHIRKGRPMATMSRPAAMCQACVDFAKECGMRPEQISEKEIELSMDRIMKAAEKRLRKRKRNLGEE
jgi:hypothetical protein